MHRVEIFTAWPTTMILEGHVTLWRLHVSVPGPPFTQGFSLPSVTTAEANSAVTSAQAEVAMTV